MTELPTGTVTFLFTDIEGSTGLLQALGARYAAVLDEHAAIVRRAVADGGGVEVSTHGDAFFVAFRSPLAAVRAAAAAQRGLAAHDWSARPAAAGPDGRPHRGRDPRRGRLRRHRRAPGGPDRRRGPRRPGDRVRRHPGARRAHAPRGRLPPRPGTAPPAGPRPTPSVSTSWSSRGSSRTSRRPGPSTPGRATSRRSSPRSWAGRRRSPRWSGSSARPACSPSPGREGPGSPGWPSGSPPTCSPSTGTAPASSTWPR